MGFFSTRGKALKFENKGTSHTLYVSEPVEMEQQRDYDTDEPLFWDTEKTRPKQQAIVSGYVTEGLLGPDDDGFRSLYVRGGLQKAVAAGCRKAKVSEPDFGHILTVTYTHDGEQKDRKKQPPKEYRAELEVADDPENDERFHGSGVPTNGSSGGARSTQHEDAPAGRRAKATASVGAGDEEPPF